MYQDKWLYSLHNHRIKSLAALNELHDRGSFPCKGRDFSVCHNVQIGSETIQPPVQQVPDTSISVAKRPEREAEHSPSSSNEAKNVWIFVSIPSYIFTTGWLITRTSLRFILQTSTVVIWGRAYFTLLCQCKS
jgi:hypothetical protein